MPRTTDGYHLVIRNPPALCHISRVSGGEHPPNTAVLGTALCGAWRRRHGGAGAPRGMSSTGE